MKRGNPTSLRNENPLIRLAMSTKLQSINEKWHETLSYVHGIVYFPLLHSLLKTSLSSK